MKPKIITVIIQPDPVALAREEHATQVLTDGRFSAWQCSCGACGAWRDRLGAERGALGHRRWAAARMARAGAVRAAG